MKIKFLNSTKSAVWIMFLTAVCANQITMSLGKTDTSISGETKFVKPLKKDRIDLAIAQEYEMTRNPSNGDVPRQELLQVMKTQQKKNVQKSSGSWEERGPTNVGGRTRALIFDMRDNSGNTVLAGGVSGGIWKTENINSGMPIWRNLSSEFGNLAISTLAQSPKNKNVFYAGTGEGYFGPQGIRGLGIWKSTDSGETWEHLPNTSSNTFRFIQKIVVDNNGYVYLGTYDDGIYRSTNDGYSWSQVLGKGKGSTSDKTSDIEVAKDGTLFASMGIHEQDGIYRSTNKGSSWSKQRTGLPANNFSRIELACAPSNANYVYALVQNKGTGECMGIYRSTNKGGSWTQKVNPGASGMNSFARFQAWYNLIAAVSPANPSEIWIGGIDLLKSKDGGSSWKQVSQWTGNGGMNEVHADQHAIAFHPSNEKHVLFGNDGGVYKTSNATNNNPLIINKNNGYNVTQFYSVAMHPQSGKNYFLAGAQDNGTQLISTSGMSSSKEVSGGDGGLTFIDQDNPNIQITSYIYNNYLVSIDGGEEFTYRNFGSTGRFINPCAYDSKSNVFYAASDEGLYMRWTDVAEGGYSHSFVGTAGMNDKISTIEISPNVNDRIYLGSDNGDIFYVNNADSGSAKQAIKIRSGSGQFVSSIEIDDTNEKHIWVAYSNYGVNSIYETFNGGTTWRSIEGNLPDMPIRDIIKHTSANNKAMVATELGVWETTKINGTATVWTQMSDLGNVRVDMLQKRNSDGLIAAATHGRGLFTLGGEAEEVEETEEETIVAISNTTITTAEGGELVSNENCGSRYRLLEINLNVTNANTDAKLELERTSGTTATLGDDYVIESTIVDLIRDKKIRIRILDDALVEGTEVVKLKMIGKNARLQGNGLITINIEDNDEELTFSSGSNVEAQLGTSSNKHNDIPFKGFYHDYKSQVIITAVELRASGLTQGPINRLGLNVTKKRTTVPYESFTIGLRNSNKSSFSSKSDPFEIGFTEVFSEDYSNKNGWNYFDFSQIFRWDGVSSIIVQFCFNNDAWTIDDEMEVTATSYNSCIFKFTDDAVGCNITTAAKISKNRPNIKLISSLGGNTEIATSTYSVGTSIDKYKKSYFKNNDNEWMAIINNNYYRSLDCTDIEIDAAGTGTRNPSWLSGNKHAKKTYYVGVSRTGKFQLSLFYTAAELQGLGDVNGLSIVKTTDYISKHKNGSFDLIEPFEIEKQALGGGDYMFTFEVGSSGGFALTNHNPGSLGASLDDFRIASGDNSNDLVWEVSNEEAIETYIVERSFDGRNFEEIVEMESWQDAEGSYYSINDTDLKVKDQVYYYRIRVRDNSGKDWYSQIQSVFIESGEMELQVYPNPFNDHINLILDGSDSIAELIIASSDGKIISSATYKNGENYLRIKTSGLMPGIYVIRAVTTSGEVLTHKLLKGE